MRFEQQRLFTLWYFLSPKFPISHRFQEMVVSLMSEVSLNLGYMKISRDEPNAVWKTAFRHSSESWPWNKHNIHYDTSSLKKKMKIEFVPRLQHLKAEYEIYKVSLLVSVNHTTLRRIQTKNNRLTPQYRTKPQRRLKFTSSASWVQEARDSCPFSKRLCWYFRFTFRSSAARRSTLECFVYYSKCWHPIATVNT